MAFCAGGQNRPTGGRDGSRSDLREDFVGFSYGFRPERGQHDALDALYAGILRKRVHWVLDADIRASFDAIAYSWTARFFEHRIADKRIVRLIVKWLKAEVIEDGHRM
jgi:RNA-directed DNA polymerase